MSQMPDKVTEKAAEKKSDDSSLELFLDIRNQTAAALAKEPKVEVYVPLPAGMSRDKADKMEKPPALPVALNGYTYLIRKGYRVKVPVTIAEILRESQQGG